MDAQHILLWVSIIGTVTSTLVGAGVFWLYKWKIDRMWAEFASRHNINGHRKD